MRRNMWLAMIIGAAAVGCGGVGEVNAQADADVRALRLAPQRPPMTIFTFAGRNEMITFADAEAVEKLMGAEAAKAMVDQLNFKTEKMVLVSWTTAGTPDGSLQYQVKRDGTIEFFVQGPGTNLRGKRLRLGADFFAVPRDAEVKFDPNER